MRHVDPSRKKFNSRLASPDDLQTQIPSLVENSTREGGGTFFVRQAFTVTLWQVTPAVPNVRSSQVTGQACMLGDMANSVPRRHGKTARNRPYKVDGRDYAVSISAAGVDQDRNVRMRVSFRAQFGSRSICLVRGLTNRSIWHDYPEIETMRAAAISITPKIACSLIRLARQNGWDPDASKSNFELTVDREVVRKLGESVASAAPDR